MDTIKRDLIGVDVGDLKGDEYPEVLVWRRSAERARHIVVIGYSSNRGRSGSLIYAPRVTRAAKYNPVVRGYDEFAMVKEALIQRFPAKSQVPSGRKLGPVMRQKQLR